MKLVDVLDSKSCVGNHVPVRVRPSANKKTGFSRLFICKERAGQEPANCRVRARASGVRRLDCGIIENYEAINRRHV